MMTVSNCLHDTAGEGGTETAAWAKAAGMENFTTFYDRCLHALRCDFDWPPEVMNVSLGFGEVIKRPEPNGVEQGLLKSVC